MSLFIYYKAKKVLKVIEKQQHTKIKLTLLKTFRLNPTYPKFSKISSFSEPLTFAGVF